MKKKFFAKKPPKKLTDAGIFLFVDSVQLRKVQVPIVEVPLKKVSWHLDMPVWEKDVTDDWNLTPREVLEKLPYTKDHQKIMAKANTRYPIVITKYKNRYVIIDGFHRLLKVHMQGKKTIKAKIIPLKYLQKRQLVY